MSDFLCDQCGVEQVDSPGIGYVSGCCHYPPHRDGSYFCLIGDCIDSTLLLFKGGRFGIFDEHDKCWYESFPREWSVNGFVDKLITQGEWRLIEVGLGRVDVCAFEDSREPTTVASGVRWRDARLIASAPKLLSALSDLLAVIELPGDHCEVDDAVRVASLLISDIRARLG